MATDIVTDQSVEPASHEAANTLPLQPKYTPEDHEKAASALKVIRLAGLGANAHGKTAIIEFTGGFIRSVDVDAQNVWHSVLRPIVRADWRRLLEHVAPQSRSDDGTLVIQRGPMWFWSERVTSRGRRLSSNHFDVPREDYAHGCLTGARAARDLILFLSQYERAREMDPLASLESEVQLCLQEAFGQAHAHRFADAPDTRAAATIFCQTVTRFFMVGVSNANPAYLEGEVQRAQATAIWSEGNDEREREEMAERMRAARAAKVAKRSAASTQESTSSQGVTAAARSKFTEGAASSGRTLQ